MPPVRCGAPARGWGAGPASPALAGAARIVSGGPVPSLRHARRLPAAVARLAAAVIRPRPIQPEETFAFTADDGGVGTLRFPRAAAERFLWLAADVMRRRLTPAATLRESILSALLEAYGRGCVDGEAGNVLRPFLAPRPTPAPDPDGREREERT